ncbi:MAG: AAA family ATPase [Dehalococcoidia bacterium]
MSTEPVAPMDVSGNDWGVFGADHAVAVLQHAITGGHLAHAYLIAGPSGVGKATLARRLAQTLSCAAPLPGPAPCLACRACRQVEAGDAPDIERIAIGGVCDESGHTDHAADNSRRLRICQVRRLERVASLSPFSAPRRIFVIDTADDLQTEAAHALLKTLEEPPATVLVLLLATDGDALLPTIRSRCQALVLRPSPVAALAAALTATGTDAAQARTVARLARGRFGLAQRMLADPTLAVLRETVTGDIERLAAAGRNERFDYAETLAGRWQREREAAVATLDLWREWWRNELLVAAGAITLDGDGVTMGFSAEEALQAVRAVQQACAHLQQNTNAQLAIEVMMLDLPVRARREARTLATPSP